MCLGTDPLVPCDFKSVCESTECTYESAGDCITNSTEARGMYIASTGCHGPCLTTLVGSKSSSGLGRFARAIVNCDTDYVTVSVNTDGVTTIIPGDTTCAFGLLILSVV